MPPVVAPTVPITCCEEIDIAPSEMAVQFEPSPPSARLKSSLADTPEVAAQETATLVTLADPTVPEPLDTVQVCPDGFVFTVTLYAVPEASDVAKVNGPLAVTLRLSPPLSCSTTVPDSPDTVPPTLNVATLAQETATLVTFAVPTVPEPLDTVHVCPDGFVFTVTPYAVPEASDVAKVNGPLALTLRLSPPLSCSTTVPDSPDTVPPTLNVATLAQETATLVTFAVPTVPEPLDTVHVCPDGFVFTVTPYAVPEASDVAKVNGPLALTLRLSPPLSCSTTVPDSPDTVPPTLNVATLAQETATLVTFAVPTVPEPLDTVHVCPDGFVFTVTPYAVPEASDVAKVNGPLALTLRLSPPLSCSTTVPDSPETVPPT